VWTYDARGRVRVREDYGWYAPGSYFLLSTTTRYLYDGMRVIQERNASNVPQVTYTRGLDLAGSWERAGGIGGLLARTAHSGANGVTYTPAFYHADGNGNVTYLLRMDQTAGATYAYDPYGRQLASSGTLANANTYRFSSKELMVASGLYYYGYRFYDPNTQRWLNRDPIQESGGINLYGFSHNNPTDLVDPLGLSWKTKVVDWFCAACLALNLCNDPTGLSPKVRVPPRSAQAEEEKRKREEKKKQKPNKPPGGGCGGDGGGGGKPPNGGRKGPKTATPKAPLGSACKAGGKLAAHGGPLLAVALADDLATIAEAGAETAHSAAAWAEALDSAQSAHERFEGAIADDLGSEDELTNYMKLRLCPR
jgi:RHS repeat-associated protein